MTEPASFVVNDADVPTLRAWISNIAKIGYAEKTVRERLGLPDLADLQWRAVPIYREERLYRREPLDLAIELFLLQGILTLEELGRLLPGGGIDLLVRAGLLSKAGLARARASLFPVGNSVVFSDPAWPQLPHPGYATTPADQVMFVGPDSRALARCTLRRPFRAALDLCTGSGIQALLAAAHSHRVLAVDINPRAVHCARFNSQALGITNLEVMTGDLFERVGAEQFDLITANPPFVPSPLDTLKYRDGGRSGEKIQKRIVPGLPSHLAPGGVAQMITEIGERKGESRSKKRLPRSA